MGKAVKKKVTPSTRTYQTSCSEFNTWSAVGLFRATHWSERVLQAIWHCPIHYRERSKIIGRDGWDSPKTRHRRWLCRQGLSGQTAMRITQITLFVTRRHVCLLYSQKEPSQRYVDINELDRQLTLVNRYSYQRFLKITSPTLRWMGNMSSWGYGIRVVWKTMIACALCHTPTRTLFLYALALIVPIPWTTSKRRYVASSSMTGANVYFTIIAVD